MAKGKRGPRPGESKAKTSAEGTPAKDKGTVIRSTAPKPAEPQVPRKLTEAQLMAHATRAARKHREANEFEERVKKQTKELREELKQKRAEVNALLDQVATGVEMVGQGDLFVDGTTKESRITEAAAAQAITDVATHAGDIPAEGPDADRPSGNGAYNFDGSEAPDKIAGSPKSVTEAQPGP